MAMFGVKPTPSIINILASTEDDQVSIIVRAMYLYNLYSMWSQIKHARFFLFVQTASVIFHREKRIWSERFRLILRSSLNLWIGRKQSIATKTFPITNISDN